jgi:hypothetical protein
VADEEPQDASPLDEGDPDEQVEAEETRLRREDLGGGGGGGSRLPIVLLVVVALLGGFIIAKITTGGDDSGSTSDDDAATSESTGTGATGDEVPFPHGDQNREGYWGFASLERTVADTFDRADSPGTLGNSGTGQPWQAVAGTWGIRDGQAVANGGSRDAPNIAVVPEGTGDGLTEVTMMVVEDGAGLVFRYLDPDHYWSVTANPGVGSWSVTRVIDGDAELVSEVPGPTDDETTVSVTQDDSVVRVLLEGQEYLSLTDAALGDQLQGGLIAPANTTGEARWDRFLVMRFRDAGTTDDTTTTTTAAG